MAKKGNRTTNRTRLAADAPKPRASKRGAQASEQATQAGTRAAAVSAAQGRTGSTSPATMAEEREMRANQASGHGHALGRAVAGATQQPKLTDAQKEAAKKGTPRKEAEMPPVQLAGQIDHAAPNHTREKDGAQQVRSEAGPGRSEARGQTPWPQDITQMSDEDAAEAIRNTDKADVLTKWNNDEKLSGDPRPNVLDLIYQKRLRVQGPPLPPD